MVYILRGSSRMAIDEHRGGSFLGFFKVVGGVVAEKVEGRVDKRCDGD